MGGVGGGANTDFLQYSISQNKRTETESGELAE